ncbi:prophage tail fiber N-terminal domain-containing protein [Limnobaculum parvum]|uniref:Lambda-like tail fibre protein N-terminal domain-containing protein n=1 Tax=Limnobaculum parvum TaxID=2172103 RepID=A0A2Y9TX01_9GAMM|nr:prophage tail fiber N-terminal domain-containing protein [Limnobaculum parvum]AWH88029.1 hypothetical protein HYN51_05315 [Limnobaculum parvum]
MAINIAGILKDGMGEPIPNCTIELKTKRTTQNVIIKTEANLLIDKNGSYSMDVEPGEYDVTLYVEGFSPKCVGSITVYSDSSSGTLNDFLILPGESELSPQQVLVFQQLRDEAKQAAAEAKNSAEQVLIGLDDKQDKSPLLTAIAALKTAADELMYLRGPDSVAVTALSELGRTLLSASDSSHARAMIGAASDDEVLEISNCLSEFADTATRAKARENLGLGTAAASNVGTDSGNLMPVGAFGLGGVCQRIEPPADWNNIEKTGFYMGDGITNAPLPSVWFYVIHLEHGLSKYSSQLAITLSGAENLMWQRTKVQGVWSNWFQFRSESNTTVDTNGFIRTLASTADALANVTNTETIDLTTNKGTLSANVKVSASAGNQLQKKSDGLFIPADSDTKRSCTIYYTNGDETEIAFDDSEWFSLPQASLDWGARYIKSIKYSNGSVINMLSEELDNRLRYKCANGYAYKGANGLLHYAGADIYPVEYINGIAVGRHEPEPQGSNNFLYSSDFTKWTATRVTVVNTLVDGLISNHTMQQITATDVSFPRVTVTRPLPAGVGVMQIIVKQGTTKFLHGTIEREGLADGMTFFCDLSTLMTKLGTPRGAMIPHSAKATAQGNGCVLLTVKFTAPLAANYFVFFGPSNALGSTSATIGDSIYADTAQIESGERSHSMILTSGMTETHNNASLAIMTDPCGIDSTKLFKVGNNLSELTTSEAKATARNNLGLKAMATDDGTNLVQVSPTNIYNKPYIYSAGWPNVTLVSTNVAPEKVGARVQLESSGSSVYFVVRASSGYAGQMVLNVAEEYKAGSFQMLSTANTVSDENGFLKCIPKDTTPDNSLNALAKVTNTDSINLLANKGNLSASVKISTDAGNQLQKKADGLYVPVGGGAVYSGATTLTLNSLNWGNLPSSTLGTKSLKSAVQIDTDGWLYDARLYAYLPSQFDNEDVSVFFDNLSGVSAFLGNFTSQTGSDLKKVIVQELGDINPSGTGPFKLSGNLSIVFKNGTQTVSAGSYQIKYKLVGRSIRASGTAGSIVSNQIMADGIGTIQLT